jgi:RNA polymerase sigma-70 factor, ECF subfamily
MDPGVLDAARRGEPQALEEIYRELSPPVLGYLRGQGVTDPEDVTSEVFVGMVRGLARFRGDEHDFRTWLFAIAHRRLIDHRRKLGRRLDSPADPADLTGPLASVSVGNVEDEALELLGSGWALAALDRLSQDQRAVILLRVLADLSVEQAAAALGKSLGAVKSLQRRGLATLARSLEREAVS